MTYISVVFNHHSCKKLNETKKNFLFSALAETFFCLKNNLKDYELQPSCERAKNIKDCFPENYKFFSGRGNQKNSALFLQEFYRAKPIKDDEILEAKEFYFKKDSESYPILYYALAKNAITLSAASLEKWKQKFFSFENTEEKLPNAFDCDLKEQIDFLKKQWDKILKLPFKQKLKNQLKTKIEFLVEPQKFTNQQQTRIISLFCRAEKKNFKKDGDLIKKTTASKVLELRDKLQGIRIFFYYSPKIGLLFAVVLSEMNEKEFQALKQRKKKFLEILNDSSVKENIFDFISQGSNKEPYTSKRYRVIKDTLRIIS